MTILTEMQFQQLIDELQHHVEAILDESDLDIDIDNANGVLTITFENNSQLILSRQSTLKQLWIAARSGGYHLDYNSEVKQWMLKDTQETIYQLLQRVIQEQAAILISFEQVKG